VPPSDDLHGTVASLSGGPTITSLWSELTELLRDVGPTLVATILLDGPQLGSR